MKNHDFVCTIWNFVALILFSFVNKLYIYECGDIPVYEDKKIHKKFIKNLDLEQNLNKSSIDLTCFL